MTAQRMAVGSGLCALMVAVTGCAAAGSGQTSPASDTPASTSWSASWSGSSSVPSSATRPGQQLASLPATLVGEQMRWVLQTLNESSGPSVAAVDQHVAASFLTLVPSGTLIATFAQARGAGPYRLQSFLSSEPASGQASVTRPDGQRLNISLSTDTAGLIDGLSVKPAAALPTVSTPAMLRQAAEQLGVRASVLLATAATGGVCIPSQQLGDQGAHPLGSMFKLYVLGAVVHAVQAGTLHWDTTLTVTQAVKSLPSGKLQNAPVGSRVTVQQAATLMISISDNTAADLLIGAVGQPALAAAVAAMGNTHPRLLDPFLTTKQAFTLDYDAPQLRQQWAALDPGEVSASTGAPAEPSAAIVQARNALLRQLPTGPPRVTTTNPAPGWRDGIEWYASPTDICRAQTTLHQLAQTPAGEPVTAIMAKNSGVAVGPGWSYVGYKGGSDTGVLTGSWYLQSPHGAATVFVIQLFATNPADIPDDAWLAVAASDVIRHLPR